MNDLQRGRQGTHTARRFAIAEQAAVRMVARRPVATPWPMARREPGALADGVLRRYWAVRAFIERHATLSYTVLAITIAAVSLWSRYRYVIGQYRYTFGSGDAQVIMLKAFLLRDGLLSPSPEIIPTPAIFEQPPLIPMVFGGLATLPGTSLDALPVIVVPLLTTIALLAYFDLVRRLSNLHTALLATALLALLPRFSFDSTEPDKAPFVVSFAICSLWLLVLARERRWLLPIAGLLLGLACFSHTTGYFFVPVFVLGYLALFGASKRALTDRAFLVAVALPAVFVALFIVLSRVFAPDTPPTADGSGGGLLPSFIDRYVRTLFELAQGGFRDSGWHAFYDGIRAQLSTPVFILSMAGLATALIAIVRRDMLLMPIAAWAIIVSFCFAVQYTAVSHSTRYPSYVTPALLALAAFFTVATVRFAIGHIRPIAIALVPVTIVLVYGAIVPIYSYSTQPNPGLRDLYGVHREAAEYVNREQLLADGSHILYLGWPALTYYQLRSNMAVEDQIHSFGFGLRDLDQITPQFIRDNNIRYFVDAHAGNDGFDSGTIVAARLQHDFRLTQLAVFERHVGNYDVLYRIDDPQATDPNSLAESLRQQAASLGAQSIVLNPTLVWQDGVVPGWNANGHVALDPASPSGVAIRSTAAFGGIRQIADARRIGGNEVTAVAVVRSAAVDPAHSVVLALSKDGGHPFGQTFAPITTGNNIVVLQTRLPADIDLLRVTVATGRDDEGDMEIEAVYLLPGFQPTLVAGGALTP